MIGSALLSGGGPAGDFPETGFTKLLWRSGRALPVLESSLKSAKPVRKLTPDYRHPFPGSSAAIAKEIFEAEKVVASLLDRAGLLGTGILPVGSTSILPVEKPQEPAEARPSAKLLALHTSLSFVTISPSRFPAFERLHHYCFCPLSRC